MSLQARAAVIGAKEFLGVPVERFASGGREQLIYLQQAGLKKDSRIVDLGCGVLRAAYWIIGFLDPGCYCGIEPHQGRLQMGLDTILGPEIVAARQPRFDTNAGFDTSVFGEKFDFFLAYSIWTHACKRQIEATLDSFLRDSKPTGIFLTTYLPANWRHRDYQADKWFGTSHESDVVGCIHHSYRWMEAECKKRSLTARKLGKDKTHGQHWLEIKRTARS